MSRSLDALPAGGGRTSPFAGVDVCEAAGFTLRPGLRGPVFDDDVWDFAGVVGLPAHLRPWQRRLDFTAIVTPRWVPVAKELLLALLAPRHPAVAVLPRAYRTPLHLNTCHARLRELTQWLNWLTAHGVASLHQVTAEHCEAYLAHRRHARDAHDRLLGDRSPATRRAAALAILELNNYRELFSTDRYPAGLRPWGGNSASAAAEFTKSAENKTPPVGQATLQPMLAAALYLTGALGPHVVGLLRAVRQTDGSRQARRTLTATTRLPRRRLTAVLHRHAERGEPLPLLAEHFVRGRLAAGWQPHDPLLRANLDALAHAAGITQFRHEWVGVLREPLEAAMARVGLQAPWARDAAPVPRAGGNGQVPWTLPLHAEEVRALAGVVRTAALVVTAAVSGMRACELMELQVGCCRPSQTHAPGLVRYRLTGTLVKGQPLGGVRDEWVVIEPVAQAVALAEQLLDDPTPGTPLFGRFAFRVRYQWFRAWVNGPAGQRLGLAPIPEDPVSLRGLRRTLALELAYRPGGLLAAKLHLKHIAVATTEGYSARPGGAQAELLAEVNRHEQRRNLELVLAEFRNYQQGIVPAGPGARELTTFFASIDAKLGNQAAADGTAPKVQQSDREVLNLLSKRANTLHLSVANYCWFVDPARALCLRLAGTPTATKPLAGMCDSARCPQATHHPCHRPVWAEHVQQTRTFLGTLGPTRKTERARLQADLDRAQRVLAEIDAGPQHEQEQS
jgi:hypothetical protein